MAKQQITHVLLHQGIFLQGVGNIGANLPPADKTMGLKMFAADNGIQIDVDYKGKKAKATIPWANVIVAVHGDLVEAA